MALPKLDLPVHKIKLPISGKTISFNPIVMKDEKNILTTIEKKDMDIFKGLVKKCVIDDIDVEEMKLLDFFYTLIFIKLKSSGEVINAEIHCAECGKKTEVDINVEDALKFVGLEEKDKLVTINKDIKMKLGIPILKNIDKIEVENTDDALRFIASYVETVLYKKEIINQFTIDELCENILGILTKKQIDSISEIIAELPSMKIEFDYMCINCGKQSTYETDDIQNFL